MWDNQLNHLSHGRFWPASTQIKFYKQCQSDLLDFEKLQVYNCYPAMTSSWIITISKNKTLWLPVAKILICNQHFWSWLINCHNSWADRVWFCKSHIFVSWDSSGISHVVHFYSLWICETCQLKNFFLKYSSQSHRDRAIEELIQQRESKYLSQIHSG